MANNGKRLSVSDDNSNGDTIILGNGANDTVSLYGRYPNRPGSNPTA